MIDSGKTSPTLTVAEAPKVVDWTWNINGDDYEIKIRKLMPIECWRLMGFKDEDFRKAKYKTENFYLVGGDGSRNAKLKAVTEMPKQSDMENCVSCITRDLTEQEATSTVWMELAEQLENGKTPSVKFAIELLEEPVHLDTVTNITRCFEIMGIHFTVIQNPEAQNTVIIAQGKLVGTNTEKYMKISMAYTSNPIKWYTTSIVFALITESRIFTSLTVQANIHGVMQLSGDFKKSFQMRISSLRMEHTTERTANTNMYKQAGNSIVKDVLMGIFARLINPDVDFKDIDPNDTDHNRKLLYGKDSEFNEALSYAEEYDDYSLVDQLLYGGAKE